MSGRRLLIWRHGRTEWNATKRIQGQADVDLDEIGVRQAQQAAPLLAAEKPDVIVSSDLLRTRRTAQALAAIMGLPVTTDVRLRERNFGPWQGLTSAELTERYPEEYASWRGGGQPDVKGIEKVEDLHERMLAGVEAALTATDGTVCVVTHGGAARRAILGLLGVTTDVGDHLEPLANCRWAELHHTPRGWRIRSYNVGPLTGAAGPGVPVSASDVEPDTAEELTSASRDRRDIHS